MILIFHNKASCLLMVLFCFLIIQQSKAQSMRQNKTQLVPATSVAVLKSNFSRDETVKVVYHKPNRSLHNSINNDVLSNNVVISGVDIINGKSNTINYNQVNATELVKVEATSLIDYEISPYSKASKTTISAVDLIKGKDPIIYPDEKQKIELIADEQNEFIEDSLWNVFPENRAAEYEAQQIADLEQSEAILAQQFENQRISDSLAEATQLAEFEAHRIAEESAAQLLDEEEENQRISDSLAELRQLAELEQQRKEVETRLLADQQKMTEQNNQILVKSQSTNDAAYSDMYTAPKTEFNEYYTIKLTTVYSPMEGISFLNNVRDGDEIWKENAFHLYQDEYNSDLTNISIGKFSSLDEADIVINKLKNKGLTNAKAIKYSNKMKLKTATNSVKKKSVSNPVVKTSVVKPIKNTVVNNSPKIPVNSTNENLAIKTSPKPSVSTINSSVNNENKPKEIKDVKKENKPKEIKDVKKENPFSNISKEVSQDQDFFTVQLAAVSEITSDRINTISLDKKQLFYQNINAGNYALNYKKYSNYGEAHAKAIELHGKGFEGAYVTKYVKNKRIMVTKSDLANDNVSESTIEADLRSLGYKPLDFNRKGKYIQIGSFYNWDSHSYQDSYEFINHSIYYMVDQSHVVKFLIGPFSDRDLFIELRNVKKQINDAFIKTI